ncbi:MAG: LysR family transcriptional regulator [Clostridia bacterium]|nr:LysR family transcriptional regulator [Clostridia bacterium]
MNLEQLPYFIAIASYGSLSSAARHLDISQQGLSSYLSELEKSIGMPLFFRNKKRLYLTDAGRRYLKGAQDILNEIERARNTIQMLGRRPEQELHVGISAHTGALLLAECVLEFSQRYPNVQLVPHEGYSFDLRRMVQSGKVSIAVTSLPDEKAPELQVIPIFRDEFVLAMPAYHPLAKEAASFEELPVAELSEFRDEVFVRSTPDTSTYHVFEPLFEKAGFSPTVAVSSPNINMLAMLIRTGCGIGFLRYRDDPDFAFYRLINPPYSYNVFIAKPMHVFSEPERYLIYLFTRHQKTVGGISVRTDALLDIIREFGSGDYPPEEML